MHNVLGTDMRALWTIQNENESKRKEDKWYINFHLEVLAVTGPQTHQNTRTDLANCMYGFAHRLLTKRVQRMPLPSWLDKPLTVRGIDSITTWVMNKCPVPVTTRSKGTATLEPELTKHSRPNIYLGIHRQTSMATFRTTCLSRLLTTKGLLFSLSAYCRLCGSYMSDASEDDLDEFLLMESNLCLKMVLYCNSLELLLQFLPVKFHFSGISSQRFGLGHVAGLLVSLVPKRRHISYKFYQISFVHCTNTQTRF
jgi:hypothetical protein